MPKRIRIQAQDLEAIQGFEPYSVLKEFIAFSQVVSRQSGDEKGAALYICRLARAHNLHFMMDDHNNVVVYVPASKNRKHEKPFVLQGHLDMVCLSDDPAHDFSRDPIRVVREGDIIKAIKTTLGADNGIGVAMMIALMTGKGFSHPRLELVFTAAEETTFAGVKNINPNWINGRRMINLDGEKGPVEACIGCAGGEEAEVIFQAQREEIQKPLQAYALSLSTKGGHSGMDIVKRSNSIIQLAELFWEINAMCPVSVMSFDGGSGPSAIPSSASLKIGVKSSRVKEFEKAFKQWSGLRKDIVETVWADEECAIELEKLGIREGVKALTEDSIASLLNFIKLVPNGVIPSDEYTSGYTHTSSNLGTIRTSAETFSLMVLVRSIRSASLKLNIKVLQGLASHWGGEAQPVEGSQFSPWLITKNSKLLRKVQKAYRELSGMEIRLSVPHCGLECPFFASIFPGMDIVCIGPEIINAHSTDEQLVLSSVKPCWDLLLRVLAAK